MAEASSLKVLVALSNAQAAAASKQFFKDRQCFARAASSREEVLEHLNSFNFNLIITDDLFSDLGGIEFIRFLRYTGGPISYAKIIMGLQKAELPLVMGARNAGADKIILMPLTLASLQKSVTEVLKDKRQFIIVDTYSGPDRRVKASKPPASGERRQQQTGVVDAQQVAKARLS